jgi:rsbT co-antagonist protein RsbR
MRSERADARDPLTPEAERASEIASLRARLAELEGPRGVDLGALYAPPPATIRWSPDAVVTFWSSEAARLFGWLREEAVGKDLIDLVVADDIPREEARAIFRSAVRGHLSEARIAGRTRDGRRPQHRWAHTVSRDAEGNAVEVVSEIEDAGEVIAEDVLHHARYIFLSVVNHAPSLIYVKDLKGRYVVVNQRVAEALGLSADALLGRTDEDLFPAKTAARIRAQDERALHGDAPLRYEGTVTTSEGPKTYLSIKFPIRHPSGMLLGLCCISDDVTAERLAEQERSGLQDQIIEAHRSALRELSTPLVPIAKGVLAVPLVGSLDGARGKTLIETLLEGSAASRPTSRTPVTGSFAGRCAYARGRNPGRGVCSALPPPMRYARRLEPRTGYLAENVRRILRSGATPLPARKARRLVRSGPLPAS